MSGLKHVLTFHVEPSSLVEVGAMPIGTRRMVPITGGTATNAFEARVLLGGADWQTLLANGTLETEAPYILETKGGERIEGSSIGGRSRPPEVLERLARGEAVAAEQCDFRAAIGLRITSVALTQLNDRLHISQGQRERGAVKLTIHEVL